MSYYNDFWITGKVNDLHEKDKTHKLKLKLVPNENTPSQDKLLNQLKRYSLANWSVDLRISNRLVFEEPPLPITLDELVAEMRNEYDIDKSTIEHIVIKLKGVWGLIEPFNVYTFENSKKIYDQASLNISEEYGAMDFVYKSRAFRDDEMNNKGMLQPTYKKFDCFKNMTYLEYLVYGKICRRYFMQFYLPAEYKVSNGYIDLHFDLDFEEDSGRFVYQFQEYCQEIWKEEFYYPRLYSCKEEIDAFVKYGRMEKPEFCYEALPAGNYEFVIDF